jgi:Fe-S-cluster containining protein
MCCYIPGINEPTLQKKEWVMCQNCDVGVGCKIYEDRPTPCRTFECSWIKGETPVEWKPDKVGFFATIEPQGRIEKVMTLFADPKMLNKVERTLREWQYNDGDVWRYAIRYNDNPNQIAEFTNGIMRFVEREI